MILANGRNVVGLVVEDGLHERIGDAYNDEHADDEEGAQRGQVGERAVEGRPRRQLVVEALGHRQLSGHRLHCSVSRLVN